MHASASAARSSCYALAIVLIVAILSAQWVGLKHRVVHSGATGFGGLSFMTAADGAVASLPSGALLATIVAAKWDDQIHHSCAAFEAATLGSMLGSDCFVMPVLPNRHVLAVWIAFASWQPPFTAHFASRAPPTA